MITKPITNQLLTRRLWERSRAASRVTPAGEWSPFSDTQSRRLRFDP